MRSGNNNPARKNVPINNRAGLGSKSSAHNRHLGGIRADQRGKGGSLNRDSQQSKRYGAGSSPNLRGGAIKGPQGLANSNSQGRVNLDQFTTAQKNINAAVLEYLLKNGLMKSVDTMQDELLASKSNGMQRNMLFDENTGISHMLNSFDLGKREHFFVSWNRFAPLALRANDLKCQKLEFYLHIYFAIYPSLPDTGQGEREMKRELGAFKVFLDTKGSELSQTSEFLPYYALPYVQSPMDHPHFSSLCSRKWTNGLKNELADWLKNNLPKLSSPSLFHWYAHFKKKQAIGNASSLSGGGSILENVELEELKEKFMLLQKHYVVLQKKEQYAKSTLIQSQSKWTSFSREIVNISKELLFSLEAMGAKSTVNKISLIPIRQKLGNYEGFLANNVDNLQQEHGIDLTSKPTFIQSIIQQQQQQQMSQGQIYVGGGQTAIPQGHGGYPGADPNMMGSINNRQDQSFDEEVVPIQRQLQNRFQGQEDLNQGEQYMQQDPRGDQYSQFQPNGMQMQQPGDPKGMQNQQPLAPLDYESVKSFLLESNETVQVCATLQAFRWRLTKTRRKRTLKQVIYTYMHYDLLDCNDKLTAKSPQKIIEKLLLQGDRRVLEYTMTFINALGNECLGRSYLLQKGDLVETLVRILQDEQGDTHLRQNALGALQKFSLRRKPQTIMIQLDLIKWISAVLRNEADQLTDYSIEYATALLMNLSLRDAGKDKCEEPDIELLNVLNDLVEHENLQVRTYVNGTLYSIFTRKKLREEAKELGMPEVLQYLMEQSDEQFKRQIQYILEQLNSGGDGGEQGGDNKDGAQSINANEGEDDVDDEDEDEEEDDDEEEMFDAEDAEFNDIIDEQGVQVGEDLLVNEFLAGPDAAKNQMQTVVGLMEKEQRQRFNNRNQSAIGGPALAGQSPYRASIASRNDGRPPTRPITPIKSAQAARYPQNTASNTSQITNSIIGQQDESQMTQQIPNLGLSQQRSALPPKQGGLLANEDDKSDDIGEKKIAAPPELLSRPKIPRTPAEGEGRGRGADQDMPQQQQLQDDGGAEVKIKGEIVKDEEKLKEHGDGFGVREKIARTPERERQRQKQQQQQQQPQYNYDEQYYGGPGLSQSPSRRALNMQDGPDGYQVNPPLNAPPLPLNQQYIYHQQQQQRKSIGERSYGQNSPPQYYPAKAPGGRGIQMENYGKQ